METPQSPDFRLFEKPDLGYYGKSKMADGESHDPTVPEVDEDVGEDVELETCDVSLQVREEGSDCDYDTDIDLPRAFVHISFTVFH